MEEPMGDGGQRLHEWVFDKEDDRSREILARDERALGAMITGRVTDGTSVEWWGADGPTGEARLPVFVVTHTETPPTGVYKFVTDGVESATEQAKAAAGDKNVAVSGAEVGQQLIRAGLVDELSIHLVPVLFGSGKRLYEQVGDEHIGLEPLAVIETSSVIHMRFRVENAWGRRSSDVPGWASPERVDR
jgi:dihydrofolate reductase